MTNLILGHETGSQTLLVIICSERCLHTEMCFPFFFSLSLPQIFVSIRFCLSRIKVPHTVVIFFFPSVADHPEVIGGS